MSSSLLASLASSTYAGPYAMMTTTPQTLSATSRLLSSGFNAVGNVGVVGGRSAPEGRTLSSSLCEHAGHAHDLCMVYLVCLCMFHAAVLLSLSLFAQGAMIARFGINDPIYKLQKTQLRAR